MKRYPIKTNEYLLPPIEHKYTEEDLRKAIKMAVQKHPYTFDGKETKYIYSENEIIQSIQQSKLPINTRNTKTK